MGKTSLTRNAARKKPQGQGNQLERNHELRGAFRQKQDVAFSQAVVEIFEHFKRLKLTSGDSLRDKELNFVKNVFFHPFLAV